MPLAVSRVVPGVLRCDPRAPRSAPRRPTPSRARSGIRRPPAGRSANRCSPTPPRPGIAPPRGRSWRRSGRGGSVSHCVETRSSSSPIDCGVECFAPWGWTSIAEGLNGAGIVGNSKRSECQAEARRPKMPAVIGTGAQGVVGRRLVRSRVLGRRERGADSLAAVFIGENGEEVPFDGGSVDEDAHGPGSPADLLGPRRSMALVVRAALRQFASLKVKQARSSSRSAPRPATASG